MHFRKRAWARAAAALTACVAASGMAAGAASANTPAAGLGINGFYLFFGTPMSQWATQLDAMASDNVRTVRADAPWANTEPNAPVRGVHTYNWTTDDSIAGALAQHGLRWLPIIDYSASWAESVPGDLKSAPTDTSSYAAYAAAVVSRYGQNGTFWQSHPWLTPQPVGAVEIWNEENYSGSAIAAGPYAQMYSAARTAVHRVSPAVQAIVGGLVNPAADYLNQMYSTLGGAGHIDAVADHPYDLSPSATENDIYSLRMALDKHADTNVPIDVTEFGWPTSGTASWTTTMTDAARATAMTQTVDTLAHSDCGVERILPYAWSTAQQNPADVNDWFGITDNGAATATSNALAQEYASLEGAVPGASATVPMCGRPLTLQLAAVAPPRKATNTVCVRATALSWSSAGWATVGISDATVRYTAPAVATAATDTSGQATTCFSARRGTMVSVSASATQPQFYPVASATLTTTVTQ